MVNILKGDLRVDRQIRDKSKLIINNTIYHNNTIELHKLEHFANSSLHKSMLNGKKQREKTKMNDFFLIFYVKSMEFLLCIQTDFVGFI